MRQLMMSSRRWRRQGGPPVVIRPSLHYFDELGVHFFVIKDLDVYVYV